MKVKNNAVLYCGNHTIDKFILNNLLYTVIILADEIWMKKCFFIKGNLCSSDSIRISEMIEQLIHNKFLKTWSFEKDGDFIIDEKKYLGIYSLINYHILSENIRNKFSQSTLEFKELEEQKSYIGITSDVLNLRDELWDLAVSKVLGINNLVYYDSDIRLFNRRSIFNFNLRKRNMNPLVTNFSKLKIPNLTNKSFEEILELRRICNSYKNDLVKKKNPILLYQELNQLLNNYIKDTEEPINSHKIYLDYVSLDETNSIPYFEKYSQWLSIHNRESNAFIFY
ncbi:hypothetical protein [Robertmurraya kyonggiensis]|uniref:Uncharacterized protein n=1 Tax=Robertmurraya kyonggiensis TaxID=1037680 RepID=A0A4U1DCA0_9BACI|nr:hypothetical protein [Robertmurraya kyonggiensis]TKC19116.1 hypothetical protein FA727_06100 [Robertmurraya kyonggiensis]